MYVCVYGCGWVTKCAILKYTVGTILTISTRDRCSQSCLMAPMMGACVCTAEVRDALFAGVGCQRGSVQLVVVVAWAGSHPYALTELLPPNGCPI